MGFAEADNLVEYKSYIQRRRADAAPKDTSLTTDLSIENNVRDLGFEISERYTNPDYTDDVSTLNVKNESADKISAGTLRRTDPSIYKRLYGNGLTNRYSGYSNNYRNNKTSRYTNEDTDNGTAVLAIKIIKQSLVCFALLGIVVFMQSKSELTHALEFVKKYVVDADIEAKTLISGVENIFKECTRFLGGVP